MTEQIDPAVPGNGEALPAIPPAAEPSAPGSADETPKPPPKLPPPAAWF